MVSRMIADMQAIEKGNRDYHPTPLSSCCGRDVWIRGKTSLGGALLQLERVQGVGCADVADSLASPDEVVFRSINTHGAGAKALRTNYASSSVILVALWKPPSMERPCAA